VETLFNEVTPFFSALYPEIFPQIIKSNVLTYDQIVEASAAYTDIAARQYGIDSEAAQHPFCALYALGLIGIVQQSRDDPARLVQKFAPVGEIAFGQIHVLPQAETYLIHPSLSDFITRRNVAFLKELNRHNVIGDELEWRPEESIRFVAVGDIRGYRENVVQIAGRSQTFDKYWRDLFRQFTRDLDYANASAGDALVLADRSPGRLLRAAIGLGAQLGVSGYNLQIRMGAHSGLPWRAPNILKFPTSSSSPHASNLSRNREISCCPNNSSRTLDDMGTTSRETCLRVSTKNMSGWSDIKLTMGF
jgi:hypothetical protein